MAFAKSTGLHGFHSGVVKVVYEPKREQETNAALICTLGVYNKKHTSL